MHKKNLTLLIERVNLRTALMAFVFFVGGFLLMLWAANDTLWLNRTTWKNLVESLGSLLFGTGLITAAWDLLGKRAFAEELLSKVSISRELASAGILQVKSSFQSREIDWENLFSRTIKIDLLFLGSSTWRNQHFRQLEAFVERTNTSLRVLLPDPNDSHTVSELAHRMDKKTNEIEVSINRAIDFFRDLSARHPHAQIQVWLVKQAPLFSIFRFDNKAVVSFYSHRRRLVEVPTFICTEGGELFNYVMEEVDELLRQNKLATKLNMPTSRTP